MIKCSHNHLRTIAKKSCFNFQLLFSLLALYFHSSINTSPCIYTPTFHSISLFLFQIIHFSYIYSTIPILILPPPHSHTILPYIHPYLPPSHSHAILPYIHLILPHLTPMPYYYISTPLPCHITI